MIIKKITLIISVLILQSCSLEPKIVITKDYIKNKHWDTYNHILLIERMKLKKDSVLNVMDPNFEGDIPNHWNITDKLEVDSTFIYRNSISEEDIKSNSKIYFDQKNKNDWHFDLFVLHVLTDYVYTLTYYKV